MKPKVAILVLNWNGKELTKRCLESLAESNYPNQEVIEIDNGSTDGSEESIKAEFPSVHIIQNGENLGYAEGNNRGIKWALSNGADYIFVVNNDTVIHKDCISRLIEAAEKNSSFGILGPIGFEYGFWDRPLSSGFNLDWESKWVWPFQWGDGLKMLVGDKEIFPFDLVQGDAFFVRRTVFEKVGFFDRRFFLAFEEFDLCIRAKREGFDIGVVREARYQRMKSGTFGKYRYRFLYYNTRNFLLFVLKNSGLKSKKDVLVHYLKRVKWDFEDRVLKGKVLSQDFNYLFRFIAGAFPMIHGCFDFLIGRFGKLRLW